MSEYFLTSRREYSSAELKELTSRWVNAERVPARFRVITDTSDFFRVEYDDVLLLNGRPYLVRNTEKEGRFGLDDEPKFWVRRSIDLLDGKEKIIKMVFHEHFKVRAKYDVPGKICDTLALFQAANGCTGAPVVTRIPDRFHDGTRVFRQSIASCRGRSRINLYEIRGGGHNWPGPSLDGPGLLVGKTSREIDASQVIWDFFNGR